MSKRAEKKPGGWGDRIRMIGVLVGIASGAIAIWGFIHPNPTESPDNNFAILGKKIDAVVAILQQRPTPAPTEALTGEPTGRPDQGTFVPMDTLSSQGLGIQMSNATTATVTANQANQINFLLRVTSSSKSPWKIFAVNPGGSFPGWSVSTKSGAHCTAQWPTLTGVQVFQGYEGHIVEMQTLDPGSTLNASVSAVCDKVYSTDTFYLATQLRTLPSNAVEGPPGTLQLDVVNFSSKAITLQGS